MLQYIARIPFIVSTFPHAERKYCHAPHLLSTTISSVAVISRRSRNVLLTTGQRHDTRARQSFYGRRGCPPSCLQDQLALKVVDELVRVLHDHTPLQVRTIFGMSQHTQRPFDNLLDLCRAGSNRRQPRCETGVLSSNGRLLPTNFLACLVGLSDRPGIHKKNSLVVLDSAVAVETRVGCRCRRHGFRDDPCNRWEKGFST